MRDFNTGLLPIEPSHVQMDQATINAYSIRPRVEPFHVQMDQDTINHYDCINIFLFVLIFVYFRIQWKYYNYSTNCLSSPSSFAIYLYFNLLHVNKDNIYSSSRRPVYGEFSRDPRGKGYYITSSYLVVYGCFLCEV